MFVQLQCKSRFQELHLSNALPDWNMNEEIKLTTTTDQFHHDETRSGRYLTQWHYARISRRSLSASYKDQQLPSADREPDIQPNLWLMVNPCLACPIKYPTSQHKATPSPAAPPTTTTHTSKPVESLFNDSSENQLTDEDEAWCADVPLCGKVKAARSAHKLGLLQKRRLQRALQDSVNLKSGGWPRPPVNYCILIAMALSSCRSGSLNVQQIYNFTREHFPFFLTAPDGWKNTIRHNLCFSNSFKKTQQQQVCGDGRRKSCLWHLTLDGRRRLSEEIHMLTAQTFQLLKRSMNYPDMIQSLLKL